MSNLVGLANAFLLAANDAMEKAAPEKKITPTGLIECLKSPSFIDKMEIIPVDAGGGHKQAVNIRYQNRSIASDTVTTPSCNPTLTFPYLTVTQNVTKFRQLGVWLDRQTVATYVKDSSAAEKAGSINAPVFAELMKQITLLANGLVEGINQDLWASIISNVGVNVVTGNNTPVSINIPKTVTTVDLTNGVGKILQDYETNNFTDTPHIIGNGYFHNWDILNRNKRGIDIAGIDNRALGDAINFFYDKQSYNYVNSNGILVIEPGSTQMIEYYQNEGMFAGDAGTDFFFTIELPCQILGTIVSMKFDVQLRYINCQTQLPVGYGGAMANVNPGYAVILSKWFDLFTTPANSYKAGDAYYGVNGILQYAITNS